MINVSSKNGLSTSRSVKFEEPKHEDTETVSMEFDGLETPSRDESKESLKTSEKNKKIKVNSKKNIR